MCTVLGDNTMTKHSKTLSYSRARRGVLYTASAPVRRSSNPAGALPRTLSPQARSQNREVPELPLPSIDRRFYTPVQNPPAKRFSGSPARVVSPPLKNRPVGRPGTSQVPFNPPKPLRIPAARLLFAQPAGVAVCVQRGKRKEVLHAKGIAGQTGLNPGKSGPFSKVRCK